MRRNIQTCKVSEKKREEFMQRKILSQDRNRPVILKEVANIIVSGVPWYRMGLNRQRPDYKGFVSQTEEYRFYSKDWEFFNSLYCYHC